MTPQQRDAERGTTLIELLVVMVIFTALMGLVYGVLGQVQTQTANTQRRADSVDQARLGLSQIDRHVRSGKVLYDPLSEPLPLSMRVFTQADGEQRCVQWQVYRPPATPAGTPGVLRYRSWTSNGVSFSNVELWSTIARGVMNDAANPPFALDPAALYGRRLLNVRLLVQTPRDSAAPVEVQSSLSGRNTQYGYDPGSCNPMPPA